MEDMTEWLRPVQDPELPVGIVDLGMVKSAERDVHGHVIAVLVPTFLGCPAQLFIEEAVTEALSGSGTSSVEVRWSTDQWTLERVSAAGREQLRSHGLTVADADGSLVCPYCGAPELEVQSEWGSALCRKTAYCTRCRTPVEILKGPAPASAAVNFRPPRLGP